MADPAPPPKGVPHALHLRRPGLRLDIEGLRAIAVLLVLIYHAGARFIPGGFIGVDVFFVLSGFLITGILIREVEKTGRISLSRFYARRAKRLLPAAGVVLVTTALLTWWSSSVVDWRTFGGDIISAAVYVVNWVLAGRSVDYLAEDVGVSPVQHFWSLAVEEQFYIVWPLLLVLTAWWYRRRGGRLRPLMTVGILLIAVPSFIWSIQLTGANPERAFFVTTTRLWEMSIGAFVAIGAHVWPRMPKAVAAALGWLGLGAVLLSGVIITANTPWPGYAALLPTLGTAAVIVSGFAPSTASPAGVLSWGPAVWVGGLSYSLYLWHWPLLVAANSRWGTLSLAQGTLVVLAGFIPAYLGHRFIENPLRFGPAVSRSNGLALSMGANFSLIGVVAGLALILAVPGQAPPKVPDETNSQARGAAVLLDPGQATVQPGTLESLDNVDWFVPAATDAVEDLPAGYADDCQVDRTSSEPVRCEYGDPSSDTVIAVVGDSKVLQWQSALEDIGQRQGWRFVSYTKSVCAFSTGVQNYRGEPYVSCAEWNEAVLADILNLKPDVVLTSSRIATALADRNDVKSDTEDAMVAATIDAWSAVNAAGIGVVGIIDNPGPVDIAVYECVADSPDHLADCAFDRDKGMERSSAAVFQAAAREAPQARLVDVREFICPDGSCVPVIGNVLVYRQTSHLTDTYVRTLIPMFEAELVSAVDEVARR